MAVDTLSVGKKAVTDAFQRELGRTPTQAESDFFVKQWQGYGGRGQLSPYEMQQYVASTPEAQLQGLNKYAGLYGQQLGASDQYTLGQAQNQLMGQFRAQGRPTSSGYIAAFASAAQNLAAQKQQQMAQFYGGGLQDVMSNQQQTGQLALGRAQSLQDQQRQFEQNSSLAQQQYYQQQNDYQNMLNQANRQQKTSALMGLAGTALGAGIGGAVGGWGGAYLGGQLGGGLGTYAGRSFS